MIKKFVEVIRIGSTHGLNGTLKLYPLGSQIDIILSYGPWYIQQNKTTNIWKKIKVANIVNKRNNTYIKFAGINDVNKAKKYVNSIIGVPKSALPILKNNETYWVDLIGKNVKNSNEDNFGKIIDIIETGYNEVLVCSLYDKEYLIPFASKYVLEQIDENIIVDWRYDY